MRVCGIGAVFPTDAPCGAGVRACYDRGTGAVEIIRLP